MTCYAGGQRYTREAGVRQLEREIGTLLRKTAAAVASGTAAKPVVIDQPFVRQSLGRAKVFHEVAARTATPGVATGLAVTGVGGDVLFVEAATMSGNAGLVLTGQLGDVMKESARIALTVVRGNAARLGIKDEAFFGHEFHVHVPAEQCRRRSQCRRHDGNGDRIAALRTQRQEHGRHDREVHAAGVGLAIGGLKQKVLRRTRRD